MGKSLKTDPTIEAEIIVQIAFRQRAAGDLRIGIGLWNSLQYVLAAFTASGHCNHRGEEGDKNQEIKKLSGAGQLPHKYLNVNQRIYIISY